MTRVCPMKIADLSVFVLLFAAACVEEGEASPGDLAELDDPAESAVDGALVELDGLAAISPPPGVSVWSELLHTDGTTQQFVLHTTLAGEVVFEELGDEPRIHALERTSAAPEPAAALHACSDDAYILQGWRWESRLEWYFHAGSTPSELGEDEAEAALVAATDNITGATNSCGLADEVAARHEYRGRKSRSANIGAAGDCLGPDGVNMVSFGDLPAGVLATACVWFRGGVATEGDVQFNRRDLSWTTEPRSGACSRQWSLRAVATHERGHTFGLGHVGEGTHGDLTMSPKLGGPCQDSESTLGEGDVLGLRALY